MKALFDFDIFRYRYGFAAQKTDKERNVIIAEPEQAVVIAINMGIRETLRNTGATEYDGYISGTDNFRLKIDPEYKANRKDLERPYHYDNITQFLIYAHEATVVNGYEADDALGIAQSTALAESTIICSIDKDLDQIPGWHYDLVKKNIYYMQEHEARRVFWTQMLVGDRVDNITGIRGIGPVKAEKALAECYDEDAYKAVVMPMYEKEFKDDAKTMFNKNFNLLKICTSEEEIPVL
jgi:5'-3' exonuclease